MLRSPENVEKPGKSRYRFVCSKSKLFENKKSFFRESKLKIKRGRVASNKKKKKKGRKRVVVMNGGTIGGKKDGRDPSPGISHFFTHFQLMTTTVATVAAAAAAAICSLALRASLRFAATLMP